MSKVDDKLQAPGRRALPGQPDPRHDDEMGTAKEQQGEHDDGPHDGPIPGTVGHRSTPRRPKRLHEPRGAVSTQWTRTVARTAARNARAWEGRVVTAVSARQPNSECMYPPWTHGFQPEPRSDLRPASSMHKGPCRCTAMSECGPYPGGHGAKVTCPSWSAAPQWCAVAVTLPPVHRPPRGHVKQGYSSDAPTLPLLLPPDREYKPSPHLHMVH